MRRARRLRRLVMPATKKPWDPRRIGQRDFCTMETSPAEAPTVRGERCHSPGIECSNTDFGSGRFYEVPLAPLRVVAISIPKDVEPFHDYWARRLNMIQSESVCDDLDERRERSTQSAEMIPPSWKGSNVRIQKMFKAIKRRTSSATFGPGYPKLRCDFRSDGHGKVRDAPVVNK